MHTVYKRGFDDRIRDAPRVREQPDHESRGHRAGDVRVHRRCLRTRSKRKPQGTATLPFASSDMVPGNPSSAENVVLTPGDKRRKILTIN